MQRPGVFARIAGVLTIALGLAAAGGAQAAQTTGTLTVTARLGGSCRFNPPSTTAFTLAFGTYTPTAGNLGASTTFRVQCSNGLAYQVALGGGGSGDVLNRQLTATGAPAEKVDYQLYADAAYTTVWGDGTGGTAIQAGVGGGGPRTFTIYGRVPDSSANQNAAVRNDYRDTVTITVTY
jgi:spore coat protein U-like protein